MAGKKIRYVDIADIIKKKIQQGVFPQGQALPSQKELSEIFKTSVMTLRGALAQLEEEGIITVIHGVGTFVAAPEVHADTLGLQGFQNEMDRQKMHISNTIVSLEHGLENDRLSELFAGKTTKFSCLSRLRTIEDKPVIYQRSFVSELHQSVLEEYTAEKSLYQFFSQKTGIMVTQGREIMIPVTLPEHIMTILALDNPCCGFLSKRISISLDDAIVLYDEAYLPAAYVMMASSRQGKHNSFKYIINTTGTIDSIDSFKDTDLWEDLI